MADGTTGSHLPDTTDIEWKPKGVAQILKCFGENPDAALNTNYVHAMMFLGESLEELSDDLFSMIDEAREQGRERHG